MKTLIENIVKKDHIPGLAIYIQQGEKQAIEHYVGYANLEHHAPVTAETKFEIASLTKLFTAQAILLLAQRKQIELDKPISSYLDNLPPAWQNVTIKHCLAHQSGIRSYTNVEAYWEITRQDKSQEDILDLVRDLALDFEPGTRNAYDNTGFYLLGMAIEAVTGDSYAAFLQENIFKPLSMTDTLANDYAKIIPHRAQGYVSKDGILKNKPFYSTSNTFSGGILLSTIRDLVKWHSALFDDRILNAHFRQLWWQPHLSQEGNERESHYSIGLGWFIVDSPLGQFYGHNGNISGFSSAYLYFPETDTLAIVLCNAGHIRSPHEIAFAVIQELDKS